MEVQSQRSLDSVKQVGHRQKGDVRKEAEVGEDALKMEEEAAS